MAQLGEYLVRQGVISPDQLIEVLHTQRSMNKNASLLAAAEEFLEPAVLDGVLDHQLEHSLSFEEAILDLGVLSRERVEELHRERKEFRVPLGEILRRRGFVDADELESWIERFERDSRAGEDPQHLAAMLQRIDVFKKLNEDDCLRLATAARWKYYEAGDEVYREGDSGDAIFVVENGLVSLTSQGSLHEALELGSARSGDHFGLPGAVSGETRLESARAVVKTCCVRIPAEEMRAVLHSQPAAALAVAELLGRDVHHFFGGIQKHDVLVDTNVYTIVYDAQPEPEIVYALLEELHEQLKGSVRLLHNDAGLEFPAAFTKNMSASFAPRLSEAARFQRMVSWIHDESRHVDHLVFFIFPAQCATAVDVSELINVLTPNSRLYAHPDRHDEALLRKPARGAGPRLSPRGE